MLFSYTIIKSNRILKRGNCTRSYNAKLSIISILCNPCNCVLGLKCRNGGTDCLKSCLRSNNFSLIYRKNATSDATLHTSCTSI